MAGVPGWGVNLVSQNRAHKQNREEAEKDRALRKKLHDRQMNQQLGLALGQMAAKFGGQALQAGISNYRDDRLAKVKAGVWPGQNEKVTRGDYVKDALTRGASGRVLGLTRQEDYANTKAPVTASPAPVSAPEAQPRSPGAGPVLKRRVIEEALSRMGRGGITGQGRNQATNEPVTRRDPSETFAPPMSLPTRPMATTMPRSITAPSVEDYVRKLQRFRQRPTDGPTQRPRGLAPDVSGSPDADMQQMYREELAAGLAAPGGDLTAGAHLPDAEMQQMYRDELAAGLAAPGGDLTPEATRNADYWNSHFLKLTPAQKLEAAQLHRSEEKGGVLGDGDLQFPLGQPDAQPVAQPDAPSLDGPTMTMAEHSGLKMDPWLRMSLNNRRAIDEKRYALSQQADRDERRVKVGEGSLRRQEAADQYAKIKWRQDNQRDLMKQQGLTATSVEAQLKKTNPYDPSTSENAMRIARAGVARAGFPTMKMSLMEAKSRYGDGLFRALIATGYDRSYAASLMNHAKNNLDRLIEAPMPADVWAKLPELADLRTWRSPGGGRRGKSKTKSNPAATTPTALNVDTKLMPWSKPQKLKGAIDRNMPTYLDSGATEEQIKISEDLRSSASTSVDTYIAGYNLVNKRGATDKELKVGQSMMNLGKSGYYIAKRQWQRATGNIPFKRGETATKRHEESAQQSHGARQDKYLGELSAAKDKWADLLGPAQRNYRKGPSRVDVAKVVRKQLGDDSGDTGLVKKYTKAITDGIKTPPSGNAANKAAYADAYDIYHDNKAKTDKHNRAVANGMIPAFRKAHPSGKLEDFEGALKGLGIPFSSTPAVKLIWSSSRVLKAPKKRTNTTSVDRPQQDIASQFVAIRDYVKENFPPARQQGAFMRMANAKREEMERAGIMTRQQGDEFFGTSSRSRLS